MREAIEIISQIAEAETKKFDNLSEGLQQTEWAQKLSDNSDNLQMISDEIENQADELIDLINS